MRHAARQQSCHASCSFLRGVALGARPGAPSLRWRCGQTAPSTRVRSGRAAACARGVARGSGGHRARRRVTWSVRCAPGPRVATAVECPGPPLRPAGCRARLNRRANIGLRGVLGRAAGRRARSRCSPCGSGRFAPCGRVRKARRSRCPRARPAEPGGAGARSPTIPGRNARLGGLERLRGRLGGSAPPWGCAAPPGRPLRRGRSSCPRPELRAWSALRVALLLAPTPRGVVCGPLRGPPSPSRAARLGKPRRLRRA